MKERLNKRLHADVAILLSAAVLLAVFAVTELYPKINVEAVPGALWARCLLLVLICVISYLGAWLYRQRTGDARLSGILPTAYFILYLYLILSLTLMDETLRLDVSKLEQAGMTKREYYLRWFVNFRPFYSIWTVYIRGYANGYVGLRYVLLNLLGNLCAFMPFAVFLPRLWRPQRRWYVFLPTVVLIVAAVEGGQFLLMVGSCDVDDLILNAGGAFLLYWFLKIPPLERLCDALWSGDFTMLKKKRAGG